MSKLIDLTNKIFGRLTVRKCLDRNKHREYRWLCQCECGVETKVFGSNLRKGHTQSCGCIKFEAAQKVGRANKTHGLTNHPIRTVWRIMKERCGNSNKDGYKNYGGRGIKVCRAWLNDFKTFYDWAVGAGWKPGLQIDRRNNDENYCPSNCRWVTCRENVWNRRNKSKHGSGITQSGNKFVVQIAILGQRKYLGTFDCPKKAIKHRDLVLKEIEWILEKQKKV